MNQSIPYILSTVRRLWSDRRAATAVTVGLLMPVIIGMAGFVIDLGHVMYVKRQLQASTDAAALAGARQLNCCFTSNAISTATAYSAAWTSSSTPGSNKNVDTKTYATLVSGYPQLRCFASTGVSCAGPDAANGIVVKQTANVSMWFASIFGLSTIPVTATATAGGTGGIANTYDIDVIIDTTASMASNDPSCGQTRINCALAGMQTFLLKLSPTSDYVGLEVFPGLSSTTQQTKDYTCPTSNPTTTAYKNVPTTTTAGNPTYQVLNVTQHDYKASASSTTLNTSSHLVAAVGGVSGCQGLQTPGGYGTFYADAITAAKNDLTANGRSGVQKVIILMSDGDAGASSTYMTSAMKNQQCHEAITAAAAATAAGIKVYTVAYGAPTSGCSTDTSPTTDPCTTMKSIASDATKFYSDDGSGCSSPQNSMTSLASIFATIGASFQSPRLLPDSTT
jgi:Flp pilus assembly protein TadG